jgi:glycosyltransferase involved in cell wall biosynthesis
MAIASWGDPDDRATWSGTSKSLMDAIVERGITVVRVDSRPPKPVLAIGKALHTLGGYGGEWRRGPFVVGATRRTVDGAVRRSGAKTVLYLGSSLGLPRRRSLDPVARFVLVDATWVTRASAVPDLSPRRTGVLAAIAAGEQRALQNATHVFTLSHATADDIVRQYHIDPGKVTVTGSGTGPIQPYFGAKDYSSGRILFVAQQRADEKGVRLLLEAFELVRAASPTASLTIVGGGFRTDEARSFPDRVRVLPHVNLSELQALFEEAALFAMPALYEPWGLVYLEALLCRTPVLGLRRRALPEITENGRFGFLIDEPDREAVAAGILRAISCPNLLASMGSEGQRHVAEQFTWSSTANRILSVAANYMAP